ncbi:extracellular solute-binding protein [Actinospica sp. MGRD01-02]|uniref:Extracellular solute-binding protein n=1 Tax=Actinospica acidithermotolerans TaxID=2828514 RepID=A0A941EJP9_9ACTN|nr:extracellular solute-binding protein [Actinospica acidithermotolerans]MBR7828859.1 extracellular solute-binding protein [Actinospica acidithermotolerans]
MIPKTCRTAAALLAVGIGLISGCSSTSSPSSSQTGSAAKPAVLNFWGWANGQPAVVAAFNASHKNIQVKYTTVTSAAYLQQLSNAVKAGNAPCLVQSTAENLTTLVSQGEVQDISQYVASHQSEFNAGAWAGANVGGKVYGVPTSSAPAFTIYRTDVFAKYGLTPPTTWDQFIADGEVLKAHGIYITNYAGEDPSTLETLAMQAGGHWYSIDGNSWKVNFQDAGTEKAAAVIQKIVDDGLDSQLSFADYAAVQRNFDNGGTVTRQISTWQMGGMVKNFTKSDGQWALSVWPEFAGEGAKTPAGTNSSGGLTLVTSGCKDAADAATFALYLSTDTSAVNTMASPTTGDALMPALAGTASLVGETISQKLLGTNYDAAKTVVVNSLSTVTTDWTFGPDWTAMYAELADGWAKVLTKQETLTALLAHMQQWTVADLKSRGINVEG